MGSTKTILKRATAYALAFVMAFSMLFTGNNVVTTNAAAKPVTKLTVKKSVSLDVGKTANVKVTVKGGNKKFTAKSNKKSVATVKVVGKKVRITAKKAGTATVTVTTKGKNKKGKKLKAKIKVTVNGTAPATTAEPTTQAPTTEQSTKPEDKYTNVTINTSSGSNTITPGTPVTLTVPVDEADKSLVKWTSSNPDVATVDSNGTVTAGTLAGPVTISAKINGKEIAKVTLEVPTVAVTGISVTTKTKELTVNSTYSIDTVFTPDNATNKKVTFESDNTVAAIVSAEGVVTAKAPGEATITVTTVDGGFKDSIKIVVKESSVGVGDGLTITLTDDSMKEYWDTTKDSPSFVTLSGKDATISVKLTDKGEILGGKAITLRVSPLYGNAPNMYSLDGDKSRNTKEETGVANFPLLLTNAYSDITPMDGLFQSYKIVASLTEDSSVTSTATIAFASVGIEGVKVVNGVEQGYDPLVPGTNAVESGLEPVASTMSRNGMFSQEYVTSQQVGNPVTFKAYPYLQLPASETAVKKGDYENVLNVSSGTYGTYNDETNTTTTTVIEEIPSGLDWAKLKFEKLSISKFTKLVIRFYAKDDEGEKTDTLVKEYVITSDKIDEDAMSKQIPVQGNRSIYAVIALISEGQIEVGKNEGYKLAKIEGAYADSKVVKGDKKVLNGKVNWSIDSGFDRAANSDVNMTQRQAGTYIPDREYIKDGYIYTYNVPSFPYVGNAIIKVKDSTQNGKVVAYYTYPIKNVSVGNDPWDVQYQNTNSIADFKYGDYGFAAQVAAKEYLTETGSIQADGNYVTVTSGTDTGYTALKAKFDLSEYGVETTSEYDVHTYVQWAPVPEADEQIATTDYYAIMGQNVRVVAQLVDTLGNPYSQNNSEIVLSYGEDEDDLENSGFVRGTLKTNTDTNGRATFVLGNPNKNRLLLSRLRADSKRYDVKLYVGAGEDVDSLDEATLKQKLVDVATIHWVNLGLEFTDQADVDDDELTENLVETVVSKTVESWNGVNQTVPNDKLNVDLNRPVGTEWLFGLKTLASTQFEPANDNLYVTTRYYISKVEGVNPVFTSEVEPTKFVDNKDGSFNIMDETIRTTKVNGKLTGDSITAPENVKFTINKEVRVLDENDKETVTDEVIGTYNNIGYDVSSVSATVALDVNWVESGLKPSITFGQTGQQDSGNVVTVYINAEDNLGNKLSGKKVTYTVTDGTRVVLSSDNADPEDLMTVDGQVKFRIPAPYKAVTYTVSATVEQVDVAPKNITYVLNTTTPAFTLNEAKLDKNNRKITLTFSNALDADTKLTTKMFKVIRENENADDTIYGISSVERGADAKQVVITLNNEGDLAVDASAIELSIIGDGDNILTDYYKQQLFGVTTTLSEDE